MRTRALAAAGATLVLAACMHFGGMPGETKASTRQQRQIAARVLELAENARPECRRRNVTDTELVDLHPDGKVMVERWTVTACGERMHYLVSFPPTGRGTGFLVNPERRQ